MIAGNREDLIELIEKVKSSSEKAGLYLNVKKTKVMATGELDSIIVDGVNIEVVERFVFLGALITSDGQIDMELRRRIAMGKSVMGSLRKIFKDRDLRLATNYSIRCRNLEYKEEGKRKNRCFRNVVLELQKPAWSDLYR